VANDEAGIEILNNVIFLGDDASRWAKAGSNDYECKLQISRMLFCDKFKK
jgi:hypothetical protein